MKTSSLAILLALFSLSACEGEEFSVERAGTTSDNSPVTYVEYPSVLGGSPATANEFPSLVSIQILKGDPATWQHACVGALYSDHEVIGPAHCIDGVAFTDLRVVAGIHLLSDLTNAQISTVDTYTKHENYDVGVNMLRPNDIVIINLDQPFTLNTEVAVATMPGAPLAGSLVGQNVTCVGWGRTDDSVTLSDAVLKVDMPVIATLDAMVKLFLAPGFEFLDDSLQITLYDSNNVKGCGGNLVYFGGTLIAVGSFMPEAGGVLLPNFPNVQTDLSAYLTWITNNTDAPPAVFVGTAAIISGTDASPGEFPSMVHIQKFSGTWDEHCNGFLYSNSYVVAAAHCVDGQIATNLRVIAGLQQRSDMTGTQTAIVGSYTIHPGYGVGDGIGLGNIAVLTLQTPIAPNGGTIQFATLPVTPHVTGNVHTCAGWGRYGSSLIWADTLAKTNIAIIGDAEATFRLGPLSGADDDFDGWQIAIYDPADNVTCGGGVLYNGNTAIGLGSVMQETVTGAPNPALPSVLTDIFSYAAWISANAP